jgi:regulator of protease activity HflC (stomatin/prohibitin superfamily)
MSTMILFKLPVVEEKRRLLHRQFSGNLNNVTDAVRSHLVNCMKSTSSLMSATENQQSRKTEYTQLVHRQMNEGLYKLNRVESIVKDVTDEEGKSITVVSTALSYEKDKDGSLTSQPEIAQVSPLVMYGIEVIQFSVTGTEYDPETRKQFAKKKEMKLKSETSKFEREQEVQQRLMVQEKGLREKAEVESIANKEMAEAIIKAEKEKRVAELESEQKASVALQTKIKAETKANQLLEVAKINKEEAETKANQELEVAKIRAEAAEKEAEAIVSLAKAQEEKIARGGAITEKEQVLAEIKAQRDVEVAKHLAQIKTPTVVIAGGSDGGGSNITESLINLKLLEATGILDGKKAPVKK